MTEQNLERTALLRKFPLFSDLEDRELQLVSQHIVATEFEAGKVLITQNEPADAVYILETGAVKVLVNGEMVAQVDQAQCFGEMSCLIPGSPASATVVVARPSRVLRIDKPHFLEAVENIPKLWKTLFLQMNDRFKAVNMRLSEVLEHTPQGLVRLDRQGKVTNEYSEQCTQYFERDDLAGTPFVDLVVAESAEERASWLAAYEMFFEDGPLTFPDIAALLTRELRRERSDGQVAEYVLSYYPCRGLDGQQVTAIDVGIEDVTEARKLSRETEALRKEQAIMGKIYENPESFVNMQTFLVGTLSNALDLYKKLSGLRPGSSGHAELREHFQISMRKLHSLKGYAGIFSLETLQGAAHRLEGIVREIERHLADLDGDRLKSSFGDYIAGLKDLKDRYGETEGLLDRMGDQLKARLLGVAFRREEFEKLKGAVQSGDLETARGLVQLVETVDCRKLVDGWEEEAARIAAKTGKQAVLTVEGEGGPISVQTFKDLSLALIHLLRNSIDHGIEKPEGREAAGKSAEGQVRIRVDRNEGGLFFQISDDGRGIDFGKLPEIASKMENIDPEVLEKVIESGENWRIIFIPGFSTATETTDISGRGVGLDAVMDMVQGYGGSILVESEVGKGTQFSIKLPIL